MTADDPLEQVRRAQEYREQRRREGELGRFRSRFADGEVPTSLDDLCDGDETDQYRSERGWA